MPLTNGRSQRRQAAAVTSVRYRCQLIVLSHRKECDSVSISSIPPCPYLPSSIMSSSPFTPFTAKNLARDGPGIQEVIFYCASRLLAAATVTVNAAPTAAAEGQAEADMLQRALLAELVRTPPISDLLLTSPKGIHIKLHRDVYCHRPLHQNSHHNSSTGRQPLPECKPWPSDII